MIKLYIIIIILYNIINYSYNYVIVGYVFVWPESPFGFLYKML